MLAFVVPTFASMAAMTWVLPRYPLPLIPCLAVLTADLSLALLSRGPRSSWLTLGAIGLLVAPPFAGIVQYDRLASRPDTRLLAAQWIREHVPEQTRIGVCRGYGAPLIDRDEGPSAGRVYLLPCSREEMEKARAGVIVTHTHPVVSYFAPDDTADEWLNTRARRIATFSPFTRQPTPSCFYAGDAFYLPYCDFASVERGGPVITIWATPSGS
jgi:hypothetical protein